MIGTILLGLLVGVGIGGLIIIGAVTVSHLADVWLAGDDE